MQSTVIPEAPTGLLHISARSLVLIVRTAEHVDDVGASLGVGQVGVVHGVGGVAELGFGREVLLVEPVDVLQLLLDVTGPSPPVTSTRSRGMHA